VRIRVELEDPLHLVEQHLRRRGAHEVEGTLGEPFDEGRASRPSLDRVDDGIGWPGARSSLSRK
jgi:hypothetical protein